MRHTNAVFIGNALRTTTERAAEAALASSQHNSLVFLIYCLEHSDLKCSRRIMLRRRAPESERPEPQLAHTVLERGAGDAQQGRGPARA